MIEFRYRRSAHVTKGQSRGAIATHAVTTWYQHGVYVPLEADRTLVFRFSIFHSRQRWKWSFVGFWSDDSRSLWYSRDDEVSSRGLLSGLRFGTTRRKNDKKHNEDRTGHKNLLGWCHFDKVYYFDLSSFISFISK